jgi:hypothetical protein
LRRLLFDPVLSALPESTRSLVLSLADGMQLAPIEELPLESGKTLGEALGLRTVWSLRELLHERGSRWSEPPTVLVLGGADYDAHPLEAAPVVPGVGTPIVRSRDAGPGDPGAAGTGGEAGAESFPALPGTEAEAEDLAGTFAASFPDREATLLCAAGASEAAFVLQAPGRTFLHLATHGYFAPESAWVASVDSPPEALARFDVGQRDRVARLSPYSLAGIVLAGANLPADALGRREGLLTAQEIAQLDLSACHLATLSACETSLGVRRAGSGLASLRSAFHAAGARFVLATLWKVDDALAAELMADFYTRLWAQRQEPYAEPPADDCSRFANEGTSRQDESLRRAGSRGRDLSPPRHGGACVRSAGRR